MGFYYRASSIKILLTNAFLASIADRSLTTPLFENRGNNYIANRLVFVKYLQFWRMIVIVIKDARKMDRNITAHILYNLFHYMYLIENLFYPKIRSPVWSKEKLGYISIKETQRVDNDSKQEKDLFSRFRLFQIYCFLLISPHQIYNYAHCFAVISWVFEHNGGLHILSPSVQITKCMHVP